MCQYTPTFPLSLQRQGVGVPSVGPLSILGSASSFPAALEDIVLARGEYSACAVCPVCGAPSVCV